MFVLNLSGDSMEGDSILWKCICLQQKQEGEGCMPKGTYCTLHCYYLGIQQDAHLKAQSGWLSSMTGLHGGLHEAVAFPRSDIHNHAEEEL